MPEQKKVKRPWIQYSTPQTEKKTDPFYHSVPWRKLRAYVLAMSPLCYYCNLAKRTALATILDHFRPRKIYPELELTPENMRPSCDECHNKKRRFEKDIKTKESFEALIPKFIKNISQC